MTPRWSFRTHYERPRSRGLNVVCGLPDGSSKADVAAHARDEVHFVYAIMMTWESPGALRHRGAIDLQVIDDFCGGPIVVPWRKPEN